MRYGNRGIVSKVVIIISYPDHHIQKNMRPKADMSKVEDFINKDLEKNGYQKIDNLVEHLNCESNDIGETPEKYLMSGNNNNRGWVLEDEYQIKNIQKEDR